METELNHYQLKEMEKNSPNREEREKIYGKLALLALFSQNEKNPFIKDNPNIIPGDQ